MSTRAYDVITARLTALRTGYTTVIEGVAVTRWATQRFEVGLSPVVAVLDLAESAAEIRGRSETEYARVVWAAMCASGKPTIARSSLATRIAGLATAAARRITITYTRNPEDAVYALVERT